ncbi:hypothetical protein N7448_007238 [Penicillium atrosanguineum]|uniref:uncharacterized protein n=1 Tax=Penicillium atrosanguineum TaxID=1132637 RepID=UPI002393692D|nr:uncharacterized protein N7443_001735 [Penicillium atrosanguineum]KAJ5126459.1 hypothetical protein N7448_007238 [Penicillium atrosanguineum]KAJ5146659.1 hypothetical protein N7526_000011 [Penicillium atrosanguineum]KAJ5314851.1 hypothetical protein N7443_001735 [Penicillium atrosanguineum]
MRTRQGEAEPIVLLMAERGLSSLLPRGIITYEEGARQSTIHLALASKGLSRRVIRSGIHPVEDGSDHRAIETAFLTEARPTVAQRPRFLFQEAPWADISSELQSLDSEIIDIASPSELDDTVERLTSSVSQAIRRLVPAA